MFGSIGHAKDLCNTWTHGYNLPNPGDFAMHKCQVIPQAKAQCADSSFDSVKLRKEELMPCVTVLALSDEWSHDGRELNFQK